MSGEIAPLNVLSSTIANVWHAQSNPQAYEWWYFDAISDDGNEAIVIIFLDNFIFSPRYNEAIRKLKKGKLESTKRFPAVAFFYYKKGRPIYRSICEFTQQEFKAEIEKPCCQIGKNRFSFECAPYGSGYIVEIETKIHGNRILKANLEWLSVENDLLPISKSHLSETTHNWNMVAPRSDVTGKIDILTSGGSQELRLNFRGTGYHDHNIDSRWLPDTVRRWYWGRAHFNDSTAVLYHFESCSNTQPLTKLLLVKNGSLQILNATLHESEYRMNLYGLVYPKNLTVVSENNIVLSFRQKVCEASFFYLRFWSEATISYPDGQEHCVPAISEYLAPRRLRKNWFDKLIDMRIAKNNKPASLP